MVNNRNKLRVAIQVTAREVITPFSGDQHHFELHHAISGDPGRRSSDFQTYAVAGVPRNLINCFPVPADK